ncbi:MAG: hypothetical protein RL653_4423 [Pseudomonadota bacterium]|jgi:uncharacterized protein (DUF302 family)
MIPMNLTREFPESFDAVLARLPEALKAEGFGIVTELDVQDTLRRKLGAEIRPYRVLGACNPQFALRALEHDPSLGVALPCNVAVYAAGERRTVVRVVDPERSLAAVGTGGLEGMAAEVKAKLVRALARL